MIYIIKICLVYNFLRGERQKDYKGKALLVININFNKNKKPKLISP